jgi:hypothetical protein
VKSEWSLWRQFFEVVFQRAILLAKSAEYFGLLCFEPGKVCANACFFTGIVKLRLSLTYVWCHSDS